MGLKLEQGLLVPDINLLLPPGETRGPGLQGQLGGQEVQTGCLLASSEVFLYFKQLVYSCTGVYSWRAALTPKPPPWGRCWVRGPSRQST